MNCREDILLGNEATNNPTDSILLKPGSARVFSLFGYADGFEVTVNPQRAILTMTL
jgi:hypothetical protein